MYLRWHKHVLFLSLHLSACTCRYTYLRCIIEKQLSCLPEGATCMWSALQTVKNPPPQRTTSSAQLWQREWPRISWPKTQCTCFSDYPAPLYSCLCMESFSNHPISRHTVKTWTCQIVCMLSVICFSLQNHDGSLVKSLDSDPITLSPSAFQYFSSSSHTKKHSSTSEQNEPKMRRPVFCLPSSLQADG